MATARRSRRPDVEAPLQLETARLRLRPPGPGDAAAVVAALGDLDVSRMLSRVPHPYDAGHFAQWLAASTRNAAEGRNLHVMVDAGTGVVGCFGLRDLDGGTVSNLGYWLARPAWGRGYATEAGYAVLAYAFARNPGLESIRSGVFVDNTASMRVQAKLGFSENGRSRVLCLARGADVDHIDTVLTRAHFQSLAPR